MTLTDVTCPNCGKITKINMKRVGVKDKRCTHCKEVIVRAKPKPKKRDVIPDNWLTEVTKRANLQRNQPIITIDYGNLPENVKIKRTF